jgi:hypothetical protein
MEHIASSPLNGKSDDSHLDFERARLAGLIHARSNGHAPAPPVIPSPRRSQREIDTELATAARCSIAQVRLARRLVRSDETLAVAVMVHALPLCTAARAGVPRKPNAVYEARNRLVATPVGGGR